MNPKREKLPVLRDGKPSIDSFSSVPEQSHESLENASRNLSRGQHRRPRARTQISTVLKLLESRPGGWVGLDQLMRQARCAAVHSVISTLRQDYGFKIENRMNRGDMGVMLSEYQLLESAS